MTGVLAKFFGSKAAKKAAIAAAKGICEATGGNDYAAEQSWGDWANEHLASAGSFTKKLAIRAGKAFCKAL